MSRESVSRVMMMCLFAGLLCDVQYRRNVRCYYAWYAIFGLKCYSVHYELCGTKAWCRGTARRTVRYRGCSAALRTCDTEAGYTGASNTRLAREEVQQRQNTLFGDSQPAVDSALR
eukprot:2250037-Rhodomonas_salina.1